MDQGEKVRFEECLHNHAAHLGSKKHDGCQRFCPESTLCDICEVCGCHWNHHKAVVVEEVPEDLRRQGKIIRGLKAVPSMVTVLMTEAEKAAAAGIPLQMASPATSDGLTEVQKEAIDKFGVSLGWSMEEDTVREQFFEAVKESREEYFDWLRSNKTSLMSSRFSCRLQIRG